MAIDLAKTYDSVDRRKLFVFLVSRVRNEDDQQILNLVKSLYQDKKFASEMKVSV